VKTIHILLVRALRFNIGSSEIPFVTRMLPGTSGENSSGVVGIV